MANPAPTINQINAFNATQGTTINFNIIGGTELVRSNKIYIYDLSDNSLICTHLYTSTESIHELPPNTDGSIVYESGKSSADFVNGKQYYAQIQTFTDIAGTQGGSGLSVSKLFWCLVDPSLTIDTIPSSISTTSYNVSATYDANTSVVSNIIQQYQFSLYSATGSLLQSSGVVVGNGEQQGTSTAYDISYNFSGLSVGSSYYVVVEVTTTQGMSISAQSSTFTVSIDTPTLGEATVVNNACDGYISVTSNLSSEYGGSASGEIASFVTDSVNDVSSLKVFLEPTQSGSGTPSPSNVRPISGHDDVDVSVVGKNLFANDVFFIGYSSRLWANNSFGYSVTKTESGYKANANNQFGFGAYLGYFEAGKTYTVSFSIAGQSPLTTYSVRRTNTNVLPSQDADPNKGLSAITVASITSTGGTFTTDIDAYYWLSTYDSGSASSHEIILSNVQLEIGSVATDYVPYVEPIEVSQSFNVTLTPTVTDETPYLFKKTGDVRGDRESLELVGGTVNWNQLVSTSMIAATGSNSGVTGTNNGDGSMTLTGTATANSQIRLAPIVPVPKGHKYLFYVSDIIGTETTWVYSFWANNGGVYIANSYRGWIIREVGETQNNIGVWINIKNGYTYNITFKPLITDLTAFFGNSATADYVYSLETANAGAGIAWLRKYFPDLFAYSPYNTGTLESVKPTAHVTRGVNQWDEELESGNLYTTNGLPFVASDYLRAKNFIRILPNTAYWYKAPTATQYARLYFYDADKNFISYTGTSNYLNNVFTTPNNACYMKFVLTVGTYGTTYKNDICINLSNASINGQYFPADHHTYPITELELRGIPKLVDGELRFDGDTRKASGSNNVNRRFGIVDLGTLPWYYSTTWGSIPVFGATFNDIKEFGNAEVVNCITVEYKPISANAMYRPGEDKCIASNRGGTNKTVYISDSSYTDAATFKAAMSGKYLIYEKATPTTETADPFADPQEVSIYGTEEFVSSNGVPVGNKTTYKTRDIFGGTIDLASGVLMVDKVMTDLGSIDWIVGGTYNNIFYNNSYSSIPVKPPVNDSTVADILCSAYEPMAYNSLNVNDSTTRGVAIRMADNPPTVRVKDPTYSTATAFKAGVSGVMLCYPLATPLTYQLTPHEIETLVGANNVWSDAGDVLIEFHIPITNLLVKRQDVDDVSGNWLTLYSQPITQASDMDFTFIDFLNQYGKTYKYALVPLLTQTQSGVEVEVEGGYTVSDEVQSIFDGVYIGDSTGVQRLKAGVAYNNLNTNQQVGVIPTLGNKYPIIVSNGNIQYDTGSVSGLIVPDDFYSNGNLSRLDMSDKRVVINDFLTNKKPKILKDWNGNIWLVVFTDNVDVSFDNNYGMGVATFTSGWTEVGDPTNQEDLQRTGLINVGGD